MSRDRVLISSPLSRIVLRHVRTAINHQESPVEQLAEPSVFQHWGPLTTERELSVVTIDRIERGLTKYRLMFESPDCAGHAFSLDRGRAKGAKA